MTETLERARDEAGEHEKDRQFVTALYRGLEVLRAFRPGDTELGNQELAERTGIPKPTITRLTYTLTKLGYLQHSGSRRQYRLGSRVLSLGYSYFMGLELREHARALMQNMADEVNAAISLGVAAGLEMVYIDSARGAGPLTLHLGLGARIPMAPTSMGRAYIAALSEEDRNKLLDQLRKEDPEAYRKNRKGIADALEEFRAHGFVTTVGTWHTEINAVGVPVRDPKSETIYAFNCGGPGFLLTPERLKNELGPRLVELARQINPEIGRIF